MQESRRIRVIEDELRKLRKQLSNTSWRAARAEAAVEEAAAIAGLARESVVDHDGVLLYVTESSTTSWEVFRWDGETLETTGTQTPLPAPTGVAALETLDYDDVQPA